MNNINTEAKLSNNEASNKSTDLFKEDIDENMNNLIKKS